MGQHYFSFKPAPRQLISSTSSKCWNLTYCCARNDDRHAFEGEWSRFLLYTIKLIITTFWKYWFFVTVWASTRSLCFLTFSPNDSNKTYWWQEGTEIHIAYYQSLPRVNLILCSIGFCISGSSRAQKYLRFCYSRNTFDLWPALK